MTKKMLQMIFVLLGVFGVFGIFSRDVMAKVTCKSPTKVNKEIIFRGNDSSCYSISVKSRRILTINISPMNGSKLDLYRGVSLALTDENDKLNNYGLIDSPRQYTKFFPKDGTYIVAVVPVEGRSFEISFNTSVSAAQAPNPSSDNCGDDCAGQPQTRTFDFRLPATRGFQMIIPFTACPGQVEVAASWKGSRTLSFAIVGPGARNPYAYKQGGLSLRAQYVVKAVDLVAGRDWEIRLTNESGGEAFDGELRVTIPDEDCSPPTPTATVRRITPTIPPQVQTATAGSANLLISDGQGSFSTLTRPNNWRKTWALMATGNFNGDALTDLILYDQQNGEAQVLLSDGQGGLASKPAATGWRKTWALMATGNFNGDALTDLILYDQQNGEAQVLLSDGQGGLASKPAATGWRKTWALMATGNFNGDALTDLILYDVNVAPGTPLPAYPLPAYPADR